MATTETLTEKVTEGIRDEQRKYLKSLVCQRISDSEKNKAPIEVFENDTLSSLPKALKSGWNKDKNDRLAYYIVKDPKDNQPLLFFSLRCGEMHIPLDPDKLSKSVENAMMVLKAAYLACGRFHFPPKSKNLQKKMQIAVQLMYEADPAKVPDWAKEVVEKQLENGQLPEQVWEDIWDRLDNSQDKKDSFDKDMQEEGGNIVRTKKTFAAVELVHICVHEPAREKWKEMGMASRSIGRTLFWQFVEPKIREIRKLVGCEYIYLFAADKRKNGRLINFYKELGFEFRDDMNVTKPEYDFSCYFMCQDVKALWNRRNEFFRKYNGSVNPPKR